MAIVAAPTSRVVQIPCVHVLLLLLFLVPFTHTQYPQAQEEIPCYDSSGKPQRCLPEFGNIAYNIPVDATNTCGMNGITEFCVQTESPEKSCGLCYPPGNPEGQPSYPPSHLTDLHTEHNQTWWQSETIIEGIQYPNHVNLTINFHKAYDLTYIHLLFHSPMPESFAIYKRTRENGPWIPYQYYSLSCKSIYGVAESKKAPPEDETRALCRSDYSDIVPLTGGRVPFATLEGRPSGASFKTSLALQEWVTVTDIRITLNRLNTFGDELWGSQIAFKSYFYAVTDIAVGGRCKCNGHASKCDLVGPGWKKACRCEHNTDGDDCDRCLPFYNDAPWQKATEENAHECKACNCNGFSNRCYFDEKLYQQTGHGGHCLDCQGNRAGANCERCRDNFYEVEGAYCVDCQCNDIGSRNKQCNSEGKCQCKPGVGGDKCDRCLANFFDFGSDGCKPCGCSLAGSRYNQPYCDAQTGTCSCKEHVEGRQCQECKPGYFNLDVENDYGCTPCFCYGHASVCTSASGYSKVVTESSFARGNERWSAEDLDGRLIPINYNQVSQSVSVSQPEVTSVYFSAPARFLGDQRASYNQDLEFKLRIGQTASYPAKDIIIEGASLTISQPIFGQGNPMPTTQSQNYKFRLHEHGDHGWQPRLSARDFMSVLSNVTAIKVRGTYGPAGVGHLDDFRLHTARRGAAGLEANWIETCTCPEGYVGQFCESCAHKYRHEPANGGPFSRCVPCNCNKHADSCEEDTGRCICQHNTEGENCQRCARGYYGNSLIGTPDDCKPCPCPAGGSCIELDNDEVICLECPKGYSGPRCDLCSDGYFGDPNGKFGPSRPCVPCECNNNVDPNAVGNCNRTTGDCLKCIYKTDGPQCDQCLPGYYGDALSLPKGDCKPCQCYPVGTIETEGGPPLCDQVSGRCHCKSHVTGTNCDACEPGFYNILSGEGCAACNCDLVGALNRTCDIGSGQCFCRPGVTGRQCDKCEVNHYGFSLDGCKPCLCDDIGSENFQCDANGQCPCRENVEGRTCDRCKENKFDRQRGCLDCPACYSLVQDAANSQRSALQKLKLILEDIANNPTVINDEDFERNLQQVQDRVSSLHNDALYGVGAGGEGLTGKLTNLHERLKVVDQQLKQAEELRLAAEKNIHYGGSNITLAEEAAERARKHLGQALEFLRTNGSVALDKAIERSEQFGQQNKRISEISQEARYLAAEHEKEAAKIKEIAVEAENISIEAFTLMKDAATKTRNNTDILNNLKSGLFQLENEVKDIEDLAINSLDAATKSQNEALQVYQEVDNLVIPDVSPAQIKKDAESIISEANEISKEASKLYTDNLDSCQELNTLLDESEVLLARGEKQQMNANNLLADVDLAKKTAEDAVRVGQETIKEAERTLLLLSDFEKGVKDSKDKALTALESLPEIEELIKTAQGKADSAKAALEGAEKDAQIAKTQAQTAQANYAERASKEAEIIRKEAEETKEKAGKLRDETDLLADRVSGTGAKLAALERQAEDDEALTHEAKQKVGKAKLSVADASKQVQRAMENVTDILNELRGLPDIDEGALEALEERLNAAEELVRQSDMNSRMQMLKDEKFAQTQLLNHYRDEVSKLREEVANIEKIALALPNDCFKIKSNILEP